MPGAPALELPTFDIYNNQIGTTYVPKLAPAVFAAPTAADDYTKGYNVFSLVRSITGGFAAYLCLDNSLGAAQWINLSAVGGGGAPTNADYLVKTANASLSAERVVTDSPTVTWDWAVAGQAAGKFTGLVPERLDRTGVITVTPGTPVNDWAPTGFAAASVVRVGGSGTKTITGLAGGTDGRVVTITTAGTAGVVLTHADAASLTANQFLLPYALNQTIERNGRGSITLRYDGTLAGWTVLDSSAFTLLVDGSAAPAVISGTSPAAPAGAVNVTWNPTTTGVSAYLPILVGSGASHAPGLAPDPGASAGTAKYLREDATWAVPPNTGTTVSVGGVSTGSAVNFNTTTPAAPAGSTNLPFQYSTGSASVSVPNLGASGLLHSAGLVPDPGAVAGTTKYLREDATWAAPAGTTYSVFGASGGSHSAGLVPDPGASAGTTKFLREDATWVARQTADKYTHLAGATAAGFASDTYVGTAITFAAANLQAGSRYFFRMRVSKTGAGIAAPVVTVRVGTNGTTADTAAVTLTFAAQTGVIDDGIIEGWFHFDTVGATATVYGYAELRHRLTTTGLSVSGACSTVTVNSGSSFNASAATKIGVSLNMGASASVTVSNFEAELCNLV